MSKSGKFNVNKLIKLMVGFSTLELTSRMVTNISVAGVPNNVFKLTGLMVSASRFALLKPLVKDMPHGTGTIVNAMTGIALLQQTMGLLPSLMDVGGWATTSSSPNR